MFVFVFTLAVAIGRGIARPIVAVTRSMSALVEGDLNAPIPTDHRRDEIGTMVQTVLAFRESLIAAALHREQQTAAAEAAEGAKRSALIAMAEEIEAETGHALHPLTAPPPAITPTA